MIENNYVKKKAKELGVDIIGIAPIQRFSKLPWELNPISIKPDTKSVIVLGYKINRGGVRGVEEGTAWSTISAGSPVQPMLIVGITYHLCRWIEKELNYEASCILKQPPGVYTRPDKDQPEPNTVTLFDYAANAAGMGEMGMGKFFLTPQFGPRQYFSLILTDAEIEPDEIFHGSVCDKCGECIRACPAGAYSESDVAEYQMAGAKASWNKVKLENCFICNTGAIRSPYCESLSDLNSILKGAINTNEDIEPSRVAASCGRACIAHLEDNALLKTSYINKFRMK